MLDTLLNCALKLIPDFDDTSLGGGQMYKNLKLTTNHPMSSYGSPVLVDTSGQGYGPADCVPDGRTAAQFVADNSGKFDPKDVESFCQQWPTGPQPDWIVREQRQKEWNALPKSERDARNKAMFSDLGFK